MKVNVPKGQQYATAIVLPDMQVPYHDKRSMDAVEQFISKHKWDYYINLGDYMDLDCISSHNKNNLRAVEGKRIMKDYEAGNLILDRHQKIIQKKNPGAKFVLLEGNHEYRIERYIDANPQLEGMVEVEIGLRLEERGFKYVRCYKTGEHYTLGKANFHHGQYTSKYHANKMVDAYGDNIFYGHTHDIMCHPKVLKGKDKTLVGQSLGCLCDYEQSYIGKNPSNWQQGFAVFFFLPNGFFTYYVTRIFDHKFIGIDGVVYQG